MTYALAKRFSKEPEKFGKGHIEGIVDAGTANNAALGGAWVPALVFGIPGDSITAIVIGVLYMKGMNPGPTVMLNQPELLYAIFITFFLANILLLPLGWLAIKLFRLILAVPREVLMPLILVFCIVGSFAINNTRVRDRHHAGHRRARLADGGERLPAGPGDPRPGAGRDDRDRTS